jgi:mono/diheme cytochrome c family protein
MNSREKTQNPQKKRKKPHPFVLFCAFLRLSSFFLIVFIIGAAENEGALLDYPAISYYNERCVRCHGPDGVNYDLKHLAQSSDEKLLQVIEAMAENQGQAPLDKQQAEIQLAYHRSFLDGKPFIILNQAKTQDGKLLLRGEVTPESKVQICIGEKSYAAKIEEQMWSVEIPTAQLSEVLIVATKGMATTKIAASESFSHQK